MKVSCPNVSLIRKPNCSLLYLYFSWYANNSEFSITRLFPVSSISSHQSFAASRAPFLLRWQGFDCRFSIGMMERVVLPSILPEACPSGASGGRRKSSVQFRSENSLNGLFRGSPLHRRTGPCLSALFIKGCGASEVASKGSAPGRF